MIGDFGSKTVSKYVWDTLKPSKENCSYRLNAISQILDKKDEIPLEDFNKLLYMAKNGYKEPDEGRLFEKYSISQDSMEYIPLKEDSVFSNYRRVDFESTQWDNFQIEYISKNVKYQYETEQQQSLKNRFKNFATGIKERFVSVFNRKQNALPPGQNVQNDSYYENEFGALSPEDLERFNNGMREVLAKANTSKSESKDEKEEIDY